MNKTYSLTEVDGNAYAIMGYVSAAMRCEHFSLDEIHSYLKDAQSSDYSHLVCVSLDMLEKCNAKVEEGC